MSEAYIPNALRYRQTLALADELGTCPLAARFHLGLSMLYLKIRRGEQARAELSTAIVLYRSMDMRDWLAQAEAVLPHVEGG